MFKPTVPGVDESFELFPSEFGRVMNEQFFFGRRSFAERNSHHIGHNTKQHVALRPVANTELPRHGV
jgi:hypothetical protein